MASDTKALLDGIIQQELELDGCSDRPERSKSMILEMVLLKGCRTWKEEQTHQVTILKEAQGYRIKA